jgi:uncharacterized membrane protein
MVTLSTASSYHTHDTTDGIHIISTEVPVSRSLHWLKQGWMDMARAPGASLFYRVATTLFIGLSLMAAKDLPFLMMAIGTSFVMIAPFLATGLYDIAYRLERGEPPSLLHSLSSWRDNVGNFGLYVASLGVIISAWSIITPLMAALFKSQSLLIVDPDAGFISFLMTDAGINFMIAFALIGAVVAAFVFAISVVSIPLLIDKHKLDAVNAMIISYQVTMENKGAMAVWALIIGSLVTLGIATLGVLMVVIMPLLSYASWHAYRDLIQFNDDSR